MTPSEVAGVMLAAMAPHEFGKHRVGVDYSPEKKTINFDIFRTEIGASGIPSATAMDLSEEDAVNLIFLLEEQLKALRADA